MSKSLSLTFASLSAIGMMATAIAMAHSVWFTLLFGCLTVAVTGAGFVTKAKQRRSRQH